MGTFIVSMTIEASDENVETFGIEEVIREVAIAQGWEVVSPMVVRT
jgi:hypothetical protein